MKGAAVPGTYCFGTYTATRRVIRRRKARSHHKLCRIVRVRRPKRPRGPRNPRVDFALRRVQHKLKHIPFRHPGVSRRSGMRRAEDEVPIRIRRRQRPIRQRRRLYIASRLRAPRRRPRPACFHRRNRRLSPTKRPRKQRHCYQPTPSHLHTLKPHAINQRRSPKYSLPISPPHTPSAQTR